jgi:conjugative transfer signal peptidase TraF
MKSPNRVVAIMLFGITTIAVAAGTDPSCRLVYNPSASAPRGWYVVVPARHPATGDWVLAHLPKPIAQLAAARNYLPIDVPILKRIAAQEGDEVCSGSGGVFIDGHLTAQSLQEDSKGRPLSHWSACRTLKIQEVFLMSSYSPFSFDSRYFGPVKRVAVMGQAIPLWTWR